MIGKHDFCITDSGEVAVSRLADYFAQPPNLQGEFIERYDLFTLEELVVTEVQSQHVDFLCEKDQPTEDRPEDDSDGYDCLILSEGYDPSDSPSDSVSPPALANFYDFAVLQGYEGYGQGYARTDLGCIVITPVATSVRDDRRAQLPPPSGTA